MGRLRRFWRGWNTLKRTVVWDLLRRQKRWLWAMAILSVTGAILASWFVMIIRDFIDVAITDKVEPIAGFRDLLVFVGALAFAVGLANRQVISRVGYQLEYDLRVWLYERLQNMHPRMLDALATGQVVTRALTDLTALELAIILLPGLVVGVTLLLALAIVLVLVNPLMGVIALAGMPLNYLIIRRIMRRLWALSWLTLNRRAEVTTAIDEAVRGVRVVKAFGREEQERARVEEVAAAVFRAVLSRVRLIARYDLVLKVVPTVLNAVLLVVGGRLLLGGDFTVGTLIIYLVFARIFTSFASSFDEIASGWQLAKTGTNRIFELVLLAPTDPSAAPGDGRPLPDRHTGLQLHGVSWSPGGPPLVEEVDLGVGPGELTVLTGPPGSGKSLLVSIAANGLQPTAGTVLLDGEEIGSLDQFEVRRAVRVLTEEPFLFGRTVRENLEIGADMAGLHESVPDDDLWAALEAAGADGIVHELGDGLDTVLGDRGYTLSGGQRQRLALARALVKPPRVLILDDALSAVNPSLETDIVRRVRALAPRTAILCVTRREGLVQLADRVVRLPEPALVGRGTPDVIAQLMAAMRDAPPDPELQKAVSELPPEHDQPRVSEADATASDAVPTVRNILAPFRWQALAAFALLAGFTLLNLAPEALYRLAIDDFVEGGTGTADRVALLIALIALGIGGMSYLFRIQAAKVTEGIMYLLRRRTFQRLSRLGVDYYDRNLPGQVAARIVHDLDRIAQFVETGVYQIAIALMMLAATLTIFFAWNPPVGVIVAGVVGLGVLLTAAQVPLANWAYIRARHELGKVVERFQEDFAGRYVIDAYGARGRARSGFAATAWGLRQARRAATTVSNVYVELIQLLTALATAALLTRAGTQVLDDELSVGSVVALQLYLFAALAPIPMLSGVIQSYLAARASFHALSQPFREPILPQERAAVGAAPVLAGDVCLDGVRFRYPGTSREVLTDVSLHLPAGTAVAVVGPTGAGKSSIAKLVARVYDPDEGAVRADGHDLRDLDLASYRRRIGIVPQDAFCFRGTVASNVAYGRPDALRSEVEEAAHLVGAHDALLTVTGGYDGYVEEEGRNLTAAQRQYVALARAVLIDPDVLILDEATSSLDEEAEQRVLEAVRALGRTTVFITHRLPVAQQADRVVVVDRGRIIEQGTHDELVRSGNAYRALWQAGPDVELRSGALDATAREPGVGAGTARRRRTEPLRAARP